MTETEIRKIIQRQRTFFRSGATLDVEKRVLALRRLKYWIRKNEKEIGDALQQDLGKSAFESYMSESGMVLSEVGYMLRHIRSLACSRPVRTPLAQFPARSFRKPAPYGVTLIMSPWNYPFLLTVDPLVDAIAAGNTAVLKPSAYSPCTSELIGRMAEECFDEAQVAVVQGGRKENAFLLKERFDYIFFTGSQSVGREVMRSASEHLTPVTLELGGKSPCIVDKTANLKLAAKRIVFGKYLNCGQTCVAPDYIYCDSQIKDELIKEMRIQIVKQFGGKPLDNPDYGRIINVRHFERLCGLIRQEKVVWGGRSRRESLQIEPTIMDHVTMEDAVMGEEIFGPILPVLTYRSPEELIGKLSEGPSPLALYIFTGRRSAAEKIVSRVSFGGGCINDTIVHLATSEMGFGGVGESGMGAYHGKEGFDTFTHYKSIVDKKTWLDLPMRYQPYRKYFDKVVHLFMR